jgi:hypothetical protein
MESRCSDVSASLQVLELRCPLKPVGANDLRQAGHCLVRDVLGGGSWGLNDDGGVRSDDRDDGMAEAAAARGGISTARECTSVDSADAKSNNHRKGTVTSLAWVPGLMWSYAVCHKGVPTDPVPSNQTKACCLCVKTEVLRQHPDGPPTPVSSRSPGGRKQDD